MKTRISRTGLILGIGAASVITMAVIAQSPAPDSTTEIAAASDSVPTLPEENAPANLPSQADDILKLTRAQVGDDVTLNYIKNSGADYHLTEKDIAYLRSEGVSEQVLNAMSGQQMDTVPPAPPELQDLPVQSDFSAPNMEGTVVSPTPIYGQVAPVYVQPMPVAVPVVAQPAPEPPASTLYIIPDPASGAIARFYPSGVARTTAFASTVFTIGGGYGSGRYCSTGYHGGHARGICVIGRR